MASDSRCEVSRLLDEIAAGRQEANSALIAHVYEQLHDMARRLIGRERRGHSWGATDLVHEAWFQLFKGTAPTKNRAYFFGATVRAMRQLLIAHARRPRLRRAPLDEMLDVDGVLDGVLDDLENTQRVRMQDLDQALRDLESFAQREHEVVMLRIFGSLSVQDVATHLGVSVSTVEKDWKWARAWLYTRLSEGQP